MSSRCLRSLLLVLPLLAVACSDDSDGVSPSELTAPTVREIQPTGGPIAGNTLVNIYGSGFQPGAKAFLGNLELQRTVVVNTFRLYGYTPTATSGRMDVRVWNPDGAYGVLVKGFAYEGPPTPHIAQAEVVNGNTDAVSGGPPVGVTVRGAVTVPGVTRGAGQGAGVLAQVGFAAGNAELLNPQSYTWSDAMYETDSGSGEADIYRGTVLLQAPIGGENREWVVSVRFSLDKGQTWVMADGDGSANGMSAAMMRRVFIARPRVDYCKLGPNGNPANPDLFYAPGETKLHKVAGQVFADGITSGAGAGSGVVAQLGYGPDGTDPRTSEQWTWTHATYVTEHGNNDEWQADLPNPKTLGTYKLAFRFSISENAWRVCDADGVNDSTTGELTFSMAKLGTLTVANAPPKPKVAWCKIGEDRKDPEAVDYQTTQTNGLATVYAQVGIPGVTDKVGPGPELVGQLGWGPAGEDPRTSPLWNWATELEFSKDNFEVNDEWKGTLPVPPVSGAYRYAVRFNVVDGPVTVCDGDGTNDGDQPFEMDKLGVLNVTGASAPPTVAGYCKLGPVGTTTPASLAYTTVSAASHKVVAQVYVQGVTNGNGQGANIVGQLGWGLATENPSSQQWNWTTPATFRGDVVNGTIRNFDEYEATLPNPGTAGNYRFAYRFQVNGGAPLYCDADGNTGGTGFDATKIGTLTVSPPPTTNVVSYCKLGAAGDTTPPEHTYFTVSPATHAVVGVVRVTGITDTTTGAVAQIRGQLGWGPTDQDPASLQWHWADAQFKGDSDTSDEYTANLPNPNTVGTYRYAYRFQVNEGEFLYCDADGNDDGAAGFDATKAGSVTVETPPPARCQLQSVSGTTVASGDDVTAVGRVLLPGFTEADGAPTGLQVQVGVGAASADASTTPAAFTWKAATYAHGVEGERATDEFSARFNPAYTGERTVSMRYSTDGAAWTYCDKDGSDVGGYSADQQHALTVGNHTAINYCNLQWPPTTEGGRTTYGKVYEPGATDGTPPNTNLTAELGYGPKEQDPGVGAGWTWNAGTLNGDANGDTDEYTASLPPTVPVGHSYVWRYRVGTGPYCFGDVQLDGQSGGSSNGVSPDTLGQVTQ
ncbi:IPT/TIG domain-containing protein [Pyxidicoccus fallax]|uniref:IPT/TIG domain-containing protein n=1 Tax=Pyxidicoccus fallax TaxID=394095 RepID=A0A848L4Y5_9BACT|nr:IPT/TIG domain-containing protein [Pyxidicoccus fallax]NMO13774.1 hypothetical protein [Pyxidicoccus fallax]NPC77727.1 IPT/TIG domain-containing protein [Pyxidicoccus fallax]